MATTSASSWPSSPGFTPPGASPSSPLVHVTTTVRMPSAAARARTPPVLMASSAGGAWTAMRVRGGRAVAMDSSVPAGAATYDRAAAADRRVPGVGSRCRGMLRSPEVCARVRGVVRLDAAEIRRRLEGERRSLAELTGTLSVPSGASKVEAKSVVEDQIQGRADVALESFGRATEYSILIGLEATIAEME